MHIQWKYLELIWQRQTRLFDLKLGAHGDQWVARLLWRSPVTDPYNIYPTMVEKSSFRARHIVHPQGGGATRLVCEQCGAEYPYVVSPTPCAFCAVMKESGIVLVWNQRIWERLWSRWGWAVLGAGYVCDLRGVVTRFRWKHEAIIRRREMGVWRPDHETGGGEFVYPRVIPYPLQARQSMPDEGMVGAGQARQAGQAQGMMKRTLKLRNSR